MRSDRRSNGKQKGGKGERHDYAHNGEKIYLRRKVRCRSVVFSPRRHSARRWMGEFVLVSVKALVMTHFCLSSWPSAVMMVVGWLLNQVLLVYWSRTKDVVGVFVSSSFHLPGTFDSCKGRHGSVGGPEFVALVAVALR